MKKRKDHLNRRNLNSLFVLEVAGKLFGIAVLIPSLILFAHMTMLASGYLYLTRENIGSFFLHPVTLLSLLILLMMAVVLLYLDYTSMTYILTMNEERMSVSVWESVLYALRAFRQLLRERRLTDLLLLLPVLPVLMYGPVLGFLTSTSVGDDLLGLLHQYPAAAVFVLLLLVLIFLVGIGFFPRFLLRIQYTLTPGECRKILRETRKPQYILLPLLQMIAAFVLFHLFSIPILQLVRIGYRAISNLAVFRVVPFTIRNFILSCIFLMFVSIGIPVFFLTEYKELKRGVTPEITRRRRISQVMIQENTFAFGFVSTAGRLILIISLLLINYYANLFLSGDLNLNIEYVHTMEVTAHRGASELYPENTMKAFEGAAELGADWIELDIQQSCDGQIFVFHDKNFKRITGINKNVWEVPWPEICQMDAGSWFSSDYAGEPIPLLSQVLDWAKEQGIRLNIELKPTGHEENFEENVINLLRSYDFLDQCVLTSQVYATLVNIKAIAPEATTIYVMSLAYGNVARLEAADGFSIKTSSINSILVGRIHNAGKPIYGWTADSEESIRRMDNLYVDNIITDDISLAHDCINENRSADMVNTIDSMVDETMTE